MLHCEFRRVRRQLLLDGRAIVDAMEVFHQFHPRDLSAAVQHYLGREHVNGHSAAADVLATVNDLDAIVGQHQSLPRTVAGLHEHFVDPEQVDSGDWFRRIDGEVRFKKGRHRGEPLAAVAAANPDYLDWMLGLEDLFEDTRRWYGKRCKRPVEEKTWIKLSKCG